MLTERTFEKSVLIQFLFFCFSFVSRGQYSDWAFFFLRTKTTARVVTTFLVSYVSGQYSDATQSHASAHFWDDLVVKVELELELFLWDSFTRAKNTSAHSYVTTILDVEHDSLSRLGAEGDRGWGDVELGLALDIRRVDREVDDVLDNPNVSRCPK